MEYRVISADSHVNEPPNLWQDRLPAHMKDQDPKLIRCEDGGDGWSIEGKAPVSSYGLSALAGRRYEDYKFSGIKFDEIMPGNYDGKAHIEDQLKDGVDASVIFPGTAMSSYVMVDRALGVECMHAYNDWLHEEFCAVDPQRLVGLPLMPVDDGLDTAIAELQRCAKLGFTGVFLPANAGKPFHDSFYDPFWAAAQDAQMVICWHRNHGGKMGSLGNAPDDFVAGIVHRFFTAIQPFTNLIFTGVFDRFPGLKVLNAETNFGWMPFWVEMMEDQYTRQRHWAKLELRHSPKHYVWRNIHATFLEDRAGIALLDRAPVDNLMFSSDYPHSTTLWPDSQRYIDKQLGGLPAELRHKLVAGNAVRLFRLA